MPAQKLLCFITYCTVVCTVDTDQRLKWIQCFMNFEKNRNIVFLFQILTIFTVAALQFKTSMKCHPKMGTPNVKVPKVPAIFYLFFGEKKTTR